MGVSSMYWLEVASVLVLASDSRIGRTDNRQGKTDNGRRKGRRR
jgi:hypothetical protein